MTADDFPSIALCMQGAVERAHMNHPDFRANGRIFATLAVVVAVLAAVGMAAQSVHAQGSGQLELPNPYRLVESWPTLPPEMNGGRWGELIRAQLDPDGNIWIFHRCFNTVPPGAATCVGRSDPPILQFAPSGRLLASLGGGMFAFPHGFTVDPEGHVWATDANGDETVLGMPARAAAGPFAGEPMGHQVFKLSPRGEVLMTIGRAGVAGNGPDTFNRPTGVAVAPNGDIFVTDGHGRNDRVVKFSHDGRFIKTWGRTGTGPGEFDQPHDISIGGSRGHVFVADRSNNRVQIFDQDGNFIAAWTQFGRPSALHVAADDTLYVSDSMSNSTLNPGYVRGITVGSALDGSLRAFIPDPDLADAEVNRISGASGITADADGSVFAADVGPRTLRKYVKASPLKRPAVSIAGVRLDLGAGRRGTDMGPSAVRLAGLHEALRDAGFEDVQDLGDIDCPGAETAEPGPARARFLGPISAACRKVARTVRGILGAGRVPVLIGGDHSLAAGSISGVAAHHRRAGDQVGVIWVDAHGDMNTPETTESGNVHGMPLAALLGMGARELAEIGGRTPRLAPDRVVLVGIRDLDRGERQLVKRSGVGVFTISDIDQQGIAAVMREAIRRARGDNGRFHVSFDMDVVDPQYAPGVGTVVEGGLTYREAHMAMELCAAAGGLTSLEMVEINPILDVQNRTGKLAMSLILSALGKFIYRD